MGCLYGTEIGAGVVRVAVDGFLKAKGSETEGDSEVAGAGTEAAREAKSGVTGEQSGQVRETDSNTEEEVEGTGSDFGVEVEGIGLGVC